MRRRRRFEVAVLGLAAALLLGGAGRGRADVLVGSYYSVPNNSARDPDFETGAHSGFVTGLVKQRLGPDGLPVDSGSNFFMKNGQGELLWWTPSGGKNGYGIQFLGQTTDALPINNPDMYVSNFPNNFSNAGANDSTDFLTTHWQGSFTATTAGTYHLTSGSDDVTWAFIDGNLVVDNGGVHPTNVTTSDFTLSAGLHSIDIFYADLNTVGASFSLTSFTDPNGNPVNLKPPPPPPPPPGVPKPSSLALLALGGCALAGWRRWRKRKA